MLANYKECRTRPQGVYMEHGTGPGEFIWSIGPAKFIWSIGP